MEGRISSLHFPNIHAVARNKDTTAKESLAGTQRNKGWCVELNRYLNDRETREYMNFMETLARMNLDHTAVNKLIWKLNSSGVFSAKSYYEYLSIRREWG